MHEEGAGRCLPHAGGNAVLLASPLAPAGTGAVKTLLTSLLLKAAQAVGVGWTSVGFGDGLRGISRIHLKRRRIAHAVIKAGKNFDAVERATWSRMNGRMADSGCMAARRSPALQSRTRRRARSGHLPEINPRLRKVAVRRDAHDGAKSRRPGLVP